jgi:hypothetical protein
MKQLLVDLALALCAIPFTGLVVAGIFLGCALDACLNRPPPRLRAC